MKIINDDGDEIEVYTADEVKSQVETAVKTKETEFTTVKTTLEQELTQAKDALGQRAGEFKNFRKLNDDVLAKLDIAQRTIYENGLALENARVARETSDKALREGQIDAALRLKAGSDEKLLTKMKDMWNIIGIDAQTPEAIESKTRMILGAISTTEPDLMASVAGFRGGSWNPPEVQKKDDTTVNPSLATPAGQGFAKDLGLKL